MTIVKTGTYLTAGLLAATLSAGPAGAVQLTFDLDDGQIFVNPEPNYSSNDISLGSSMTVNPGESFEIWIDFFDAQTGLKQHLEIADDGNDPPLENFGVSVNGSGIPDDTMAQFQVELTGVTGSLIGGPTFTKNDGNCVGNICNSFVFPGDLTDGSFFFHDIHITFTPVGLNAPIAIDNVQFGFAVNTTDEAEIIGVWPMPEPGVLALFGFGLLGLAAMSWCDRARGLARSE